MPNPVQQEVRFEVAGLADKTGEMVVFDALGRMVFRQPLAPQQQTGQFDVSVWSAGLYRVSLRTGTEVVTKVLTVVKE